MDNSTKQQVEFGVYCENFVMIGLMADAGDNFKKRASIPLAPCIYIQPHRGQLPNLAEKLAQSQKGLRGRPATQIFIFKKEFICSNLRRNLFVQQLSLQ